MKVCIIGSFQKYYDDVVKIIDLFSDVGISTLSPKKSIIDRNEDGFVILKSDYKGFLHEDIQLMVFHRMFLSDFVYVWNPNGYIGKTTSYEIGRASEKGIPIYYKERPVDVPIAIPQNSILSPEELCNYVLMHHELPPLSYLEGSITRKLVEALQCEIYFKEMDEVVKE